MKTSSVKKIHTTAYLIMLLILAFSITQCRKSNRDSEAKNAAPIDNATAESVFNDVFKTVHSLAWADTLLSSNTTGASSNFTDSCIDTILYAYNTATFPNVVVLDYGTSTSTCNSGHAISGKLKANFSNQYNSKGSVVSVSFSNFKVDSMAVSGTMTITNNGYNADSNYVFKMVVNDAKLIYDTINIAWNCSRNYTWTSGDNTFDVNDDNFEITGSADGRTSKGNAFDVSITSNLIYMMNCKWISQGIIEIDLGESLTLRTMDYGSGSCDKNATVSYKNTSYDLEMR